MRQYFTSPPRDWRDRRWRTGRDTYIDINRVLVMGVLNATPDSFSDGGLYVTPRAAAKQAVILAESGADIIDIGCQSTRPGFTPVGEDEELDRLRAVLPAVTDALPRGFPISVDTFYPSVMRYALEHGACIFNDVTGLDNPESRALIAESGCGAVLMHCADITRRGDPAAAVREFFIERMELCAAEGIDPEQIVLDPGIGFGKTRIQEVMLLRDFSACRANDRPLLAAASRKRVIRQYYLASGESSALRVNSVSGLDELDEATFAAHSEAVLSGAQLVRVHRVL